MLIPHPCIDPDWPGTPHSLRDFLADCAATGDTRQLAETVLGIDWLAQERRWLEARYDPEVIADALEGARKWRDLVTGFKGYELADILSDTLQQAGDALEQGDLDTPSGQTIRFPSGIEAVDRRCGGFYGVSVIVADTGIGKSMAAIGSAVEAAIRGIRVIYLNAEIPDEPFLWRLRTRIAERGFRSFGADELKARGAAFRDRFTWFKVRGDLDLREIARAVLASIRKEHERVLIVVDSVNTVAEMMADRSYFDALRMIGLWAMQSRKESEGHISWLLVSETNQRGDVKGGKLGFLADLVLLIERGQHPDYCKLVVTKGREGGGGDLGTFMRDWRTGLFVSEPSVASGAASEEVFSDEF